MKSRETGSSEVVVKMDTARRSERWGLHPRHQLGLLLSILGRILLDGLLVGTPSLAFYCAKFVVDD